MVDTMLVIKKIYEENKNQLYELPANIDNVVYNKELQQKVYQI